MREAVSAIFVYEDHSKNPVQEYIYYIKRHHYLKVFPGYHAAPGGKVDEEDLEIIEFQKNLPFNFGGKNLQLYHLKALCREVKEECRFDLLEGFRQNIVKEISELGVAITPDFNPYQFKSTYFKITLNEKIDFSFDPEEILFGEWKRPIDFLHAYDCGELLAVPPAINILQYFAQSKESRSIEFQDFTNHFDLDMYVPYIQPIGGLWQLLPLSHTFPPANRTNCFLVGDQYKLIVDPSPKDENEYQKFLSTIKKLCPEKIEGAIFLSHHHKDHYEFSNQLARDLNLPIKMSQYTYEKIGADYFLDCKVSIVQDGEELTTYLGEPLRALWLPGHDEGMLGLMPDSKKFLFLSDLIQTIGTVAILRPEGNMQKYFNSMQAVIAMNPSFVFPSHGIGIGGVDKVAETYNHRLIREKEIKSAYERHLSMDQMIEEIYPLLKSPLIPFAKKTIEAHLEKIIADRIAAHPVESIAVLKVTDLILGEGSVTKGAKIFIEHFGYFKNGTLFESTLAPHTASTSANFLPKEYILSSQKLIQGFYQGMMGMGKGGVRRIEIPANLAYGERGLGTLIPPHSDLIFEVRLIDFQARV